MNIALRIYNPDVWFRNSKFPDKRSEVIINVGHPLLVRELVACRRFSFPLLVHPLFLQAVVNNMTRILAVIARSGAVRLAES